MIIWMKRKRENDQEEREITFHRVESNRYILVVTNHYYNDIFYFYIFFYQDL